MAGDIKIAYDLWWAVNSSSYHWAMGMLAKRVRSPYARAALQEADEANIVMDVEELPVADRDEIYRVAMTELVPVALEERGNPEPYEELARMAAEALERHGGSEVVDHEIKLSAMRSWRTCSSRFNEVVNFLRESLAKGPLSSGLATAWDTGAQFVDLTAFDEADRTAALRLIRDELIRSVRGIRSSSDLVGLDHDIAKMQELSDLARDEVTLTG